MTTLEKLLIGGFIVALLIASFIGGQILKVANDKPATFGAGISLYTPVYQTVQFANSNATTSIFNSSGVLHSVVFDKPVAGSIVTFYDSTTTAISALITATATITVGPTSSATSTATGTLSLVINGFTVTSASVNNGTSSVVAATALANAIQASSSLLEVTAASSSNVVTLTAIVSGALGNFTFAPPSDQNGFTFTTGYNKGGGTPVIAAFTIPLGVTSTPFSVLLDAAFNYGLQVNETTATSTITINYRQQ